MYKIYVGGMLFPIAPEKITIKQGNQNKTVQLINQGEVNLIKSAGLKQIQFDVLLPAFNLPCCEYEGGFLPPSYFVNQINRMKAGAFPVQFILLRTLPSGLGMAATSMTVAIEDYEATESAEEGFDTTLKISLKEYRGYQSSRLSFSPLGHCRVQKTRTNTAQPNPAVLKTMPNSTPYNQSRSYHAQTSEVSSGGGKYVSTQEFY